MQKLRTVCAILCLLAATGVQLLPNLAAAQSQINNAFNPRQLGWTRLLFNGKTFMGKVSVDVQLAFISPDEAKRVLIASPKGIPISMESPNVGRITVRRTIEFKFSSKITGRDKIWFNPTQANALGRIRLRRGDDDVLKIDRFTDQGVFRIKKKPADKKELRLSPDKWTNTRENFYIHDLKQLRCALVSERSILLYAVSGGPFSNIPEPVSFCVFGKRQLHRVRLSAAGVQSLKVNYVEKKGDTSVAKEGSVEALKIALEAQPLNSDLNNSEDFSFYGMRSNIAIFIDPASRLPVQISGKLPKLGNVDFKLSEVKLRSNVNAMGRINK